METVSKLQTTLKNHPKITSLAFTAMAAGSQILYQASAVSINSGP
jgi:hypothetical protein